MINVFTGIEGHLGMVGGSAGGPGPDPYREILDRQARMEAELRRVAKVIRVMAGNGELPEDVSRMISGPEGDGPSGQWGGGLAATDQTGLAHSSGK